MYTKNSSMISNKTELANYIDGYDVYNSSILIYLSNPRIERVNYLITAYEYRPDLIARDFYGDVSYQSLLMLQVGGALEGYKRGYTIQLIPKTTLDAILGNI